MSQEIQRLFHDFPGPFQDILYRLKRKCFTISNYTQFAGHCLRSKSEFISTLLLWSQSLPIRNRKTTYPQMLSQDSGIEVGELSQAMRDRTVWHAVVADIPVSDAEGR